MSIKEKEFLETTNRIFNKIENVRFSNTNSRQDVSDKENEVEETSRGKAILSSLRNSIGRNFDEGLMAWSFIFEEMPNQSVGNDEHFTIDEEAIIATLQIYAVHQQGYKKSVHMREEEHWNNLGTALRMLRNDEDNGAMDRRFNMMITSDTFEELLYHLRQLIKIYKSRVGDKSIDYVKLARDLRRFLNGYNENIKVKWSREYYKINRKGE